MNQSVVTKKVFPLNNVCADSSKVVSPQDSVGNCMFSSGGALKKSRCVWQSNGRRFALFDPSNGRQVAQWAFDYLDTKVKFVEELEEDNSSLPLLVVVMEHFNTPAMIWIFDIRKSKVVKAFCFKEKITAITVVATSRNDSPNVPKDLKCFNGIVAAGFEGGDVLLVDLQRDCIFDSERLKGKSKCCDVDVVKPDDFNNLFSLKNECIGGTTSLAAHLNYAYNIVPHFVLKNPKGDDLLHVNKSEVIVSALQYSPQLQSLFVGYNFGAFQIWNMHNLKLSYTSSVHETHMPIFNFAIQEPIDDPRAFCYVWVVYSDTFFQHLPLANMYTLIYDKKIKLDASRFSYENMLSCSIGLQMNFADLDADSESTEIKCVSLKPLKIIGNNRTNASSELTLCFFAWCKKLEEKWLNFVTIFDLNQWYKEEMPEICFKYDNHTTTISLGSVTENEILDFHVNERSVVQYLGIQHLEEHYYPSALSFDFLVTQKNNVIVADCLSLQHTLLNEIKRNQVLCFVNPEEVHSNCVKAGVVPSHMDAGNNNNSKYQKEFILSVALEHYLIGWLCKCASSWCNGSYSSNGCTMEFLLNWAWKRTTTLKLNADKICTTLFDYSGIGLDENNKRYLSNILAQFNHLYSLYKHVLKETKGYLTDIDLVRAQHEEIQSLMEYYNIIQWMMHLEFLPECGLHKERLKRLHVPYQYDLIMGYYRERRMAAKSCASRELNSVLFIDNFVDKNCGNGSLKEQWIKDGGNGLYPPCSLQAMLRIYLVSDVELIHKHSLLLYFFLDIEATLDPEKFELVIHHIRRLPMKLKLNSSTEKVIRGFWELDHGNYENAMCSLTDTAVHSKDMQSWHHDLVLENLEEKSHLAILYIQIKNIQMNDFHKTLMLIRLLLLNKQIPEALRFIRQNLNGFDEKSMYQYFFKECQNSGLLRSIIHQDLNEKEEELFFGHLKHIQHPSHKDLQAIYYLQRGRYLEIARGYVVSKKPESRGLFGMSTLTLEERITKIVCGIVPNPLFYSKLKNQLLRKRKISIATSTKQKSESPSLKTKVQTPDAATPAKRIKLEEKSSTESARKRPLFNSILKKDTPLVRRETSVTPPILTKEVLATPQSILKLRTSTYSLQQDDRTEKNVSISNSNEKETPEFSIKHRKSLIKSAGVRFKVSPRESSSSVEQSTNSSSQKVVDNESGEQYASPCSSHSANKSGSSRENVSSASAHSDISPTQRRSYQDLSAAETRESSSSAPINRRVLFPNELELSNSGDSFALSTNNSASDDKSTEQSNLAVPIRDVTPQITIDESDVMEVDDDDSVGAMETGFIRDDLISSHSTSIHTPMSKLVKPVWTPHPKRGDLETPVSESDEDSEEANSGHFEEKQSVSNKYLQVPLVVGEAFERVPEEVSSSPKPFLSPRRSIRLSSPHQSPKRSYSPSPRGVVKKTVSSKKLLSRKSLKKTVLIQNALSARKSNFLADLEDNNKDDSASFFDSSSESYNIFDVAVTSIDVSPNPSDTGTQSREINHEELSPEITVDADGNEKSIKAAESLSSPKKSPEPSSATTPEKSSLESNQKSGTPISSPRRRTRASFNIAAVETELLRQSFDKNDDLQKEASLTANTDTPSTSKDEQEFHLFKQQDKDVAEFPKTTSPKSRKITPKSVQEESPKSSETRSDFVQEEDQESVLMISSSTQEEQTKNVNVLEKRESTSRKSVTVKSAGSSTEQIESEIVGSESLKITKTRSKSKTEDDEESVVIISSSMLEEKKNEKLESKSRKSVVAKSTSSSPEQIESDSQQTRKTRSKSIKDIDEENLVATSTDEEQMKNQEAKPADSSTEQTVTKVAGSESLKIKKTRSKSIKDIGEENVAATSTSAHEEQDVLDKRIKSAKSLTPQPEQTETEASKEKSANQTKTARTKRKLRGENKEPAQEDETLTDTDPALSTRTRSASESSGRSKLADIHLDFLDTPVTEKKPVVNKHTDKVDVIEMPFLSPFKYIRNFDTSSKTKASGEKRSTRSASVDPDEGTAKTKMSRRARSVSTELPLNAYNLRTRHNSGSSIASTDTDASFGSKVGKKAVSVNLPLDTKRKPTKMPRVKSESLSEADTSNLLETKRLTRSQRRLMEKHLAPFDEASSPEDADKTMNKSKSVSDLSSLKEKSSSKRGKRTLPAITEENVVETKRSTRKKKE